MSSSQTLAADALPEAAAGKHAAPRHHLLLYDGVCGLCNGLVRVLLAVDRRRRLSFAPLQGQTAARLAERHGFATDGDSMVYVRYFGLEGEHAVLRSEAVILSLADTGGLATAARLLRVLPLGLRDPLYDWVAVRRYHWFGRHDECPLPPAEHRFRFLP
jgi:predicted DCC family thiol-disulfide oxidoreductase YuxK